MTTQLQTPEPVRRAAEQETDRKLAALIAEYENAVQMYGFALSVGYQRMLGLLAINAALLVGVFAAKDLSVVVGIAIAGLILTAVTGATISHFKQFWLLRVYQALQVEKEINELLHSTGTPLVSTFTNLEKLATQNPGQGNLKFDRAGMNHCLPSTRIGAWLFDQETFLIERAMVCFLAILWIGAAVTKLL